LPRLDGVVRVRPGGAIGFPGAPVLRMRPAYPPGAPGFDRDFRCHSAGFHDQTEGGRL